MSAYQRTVPEQAETNYPSWPHQWTPHEQVDFDGVIYDICVAKHDGDFLAVSVCNECCEQVSINLGSPSVQQARERALVGLKLHHDSVHHRRLKPR